MQVAEALVNVAAALNNPSVIFVPKCAQAFAILQIIVSDKVFC
jgi:hypothetical protein